MEYKHFTIKEAMTKIREGKLYLPAIQRKFVWNHDQIETLFDSIMREYPIGTFLFWIVKQERFDEYAFYEFIKDYHERDQWKNQLASRPHLTEELIGVLDGQQRLNSMYVALQGSYAYKRARQWKNSKDAYPTRRFYLNVFKPVIEEEDADTIYDFQFRTEMDAKKCDAKQCWYPVKELLVCKQITDVIAQWNAFKKELPMLADMEDELNQRAMNTLSLLWQRLTMDHLINYFPVGNQNLDEVLDIFVRVNSAGKPLSKTDLLFSTIVAHWEVGREKIEAFLERINSLGNGFAFDNDFMMRTCLVLAECPVRLRVASFKQENVKGIVALWEDITVAVERTIDLLVEWGFQGETLTATNAAIPIAYAVMKGCNVTASGADLRLFLIKSSLTGLYGGQGDQMLTEIRRYLHDSLISSTIFSIADFERSTKLPQGRKITINEPDLDELLMSEKGARSFMLLSLISPNLKFHQVQFHQDHIHPHSGFGMNKLQSLGMEIEKINQWIAQRDCVPNLQLLEGKENHAKSSAAFVDWIEHEYPDERQKISFLRSQHIPTGSILELKDFDTFFETRKTLLKKELAALLGVSTTLNRA